MLALYPQLQGPIGDLNRQVERRAQQRPRSRRGAALLTSYPYYALAHLGLARAQAGLADFTSSRQSYEQFLALWENADPQIPVLQQARAEYAKLK
ncbi:MAG TPA: hypothetical protein VI386_11870 [Candidatus Sulfotelmatobacter sp.]